MYALLLFLLLVHLSRKLKEAFLLDLLSVARLSVRPSSWPSVNFSHYHFLLKNKCANFNAIRLWHPWVKDHALTPFSKGRYMYVCNNKIPKIHWRYSKMFSGNQIYILKVLFSKYCIIATYHIKIKGLTETRLLWEG